MASRTLRSNSKAKVIPTRSNSVTLRNSRNKEQFISMNSKKSTTNSKSKTKSLKPMKPNANLDKNSVDEIHIGKTENINLEEKTADNTIESNSENMKNISAVEPDAEIERSDTKTEISSKRKRGRPKRDSSEHLITVKEKDRSKQNKKPKLEKALPSHEKEELQPPSPLQPAPQKRTPRMASLNALAKVNAVLENYRFEKVKDTIEMSNERKKEEQRSKPVVFEEKREVKTPAKKSVSPAFSIDDEYTSDEDVEDVFSNSPPQMSDQSIQTEICQQSTGMQTEKFIFPKDASLSLCTCCRKGGRKNNFNQYSSDVPIHVRSTVLAHVSDHTLAVPILKTHYYSEKSKQSSFNELTDNVSSLLDHCINKNFTWKAVYPVCAKLKLVSAQKQALEKKRKLQEMAQQRMERKKNAQRLVIPSLHCEPISISIPASQCEKGIVEKKTTYKKEKKINRSMKIAKQKKADGEQELSGWRFEGEARLEPYSIGRETINRRYYSCLCRNNELLRVYDAVVLKSGLDSDSDYVARICSLWQDDRGPFAGEMMMTIQWYYKPGQTISKGNEIIKGQQMEVFASRHKDDNSVACIIDRCYVVTYSQYCRFKAQKQLLEEKWRGPYSLVPEKTDSKSSLLPSPDFDSSLVFFCRYGYDYRSGKLIKSHY